MDLGRGDRRGLFLAAEPVDPVGRPGVHHAALFWPTILRALA